MEVQPIHLSIDDFKKLQRHEIGHGTDGAVYKYNRNELIKIYHSNFTKILACMDSINDDDVKIYKKGTPIRTAQQPITAYFYNAINEEQLRLPAKSAMLYAMSRQKNVTMTKLPKNMVYVDKIFAGYVLDYIHGIQLHKLIGLPLRTKKIIMLRIIKKVKELIDNNIYHIDLNNSPFSKQSIYINDLGQMESVGHSHVLIGSKFEPWLIDLEGKSTVYTEKRDENYELLCLRGLCQLLVEFLLAIDLDEIQSYEDELETLSDMFERARVKSEYISKLSEFSLNIEEMEGLVKALN